MRQKQGMRQTRFYMRSFSEWVFSLKNAYQGTLLYYQTVVLFEFQIRGVCGK